MGIPQNFLAAKDKKEKTIVIILMCPCRHKNELFSIHDAKYQINGYQKKTKALSRPGWMIHILSATTVFHTFKKGCFS